MAQLGFYFDATKCIGCRVCQIACKDKNRLPIGTLFRTVNSYTAGEYPNISGFNLSMSCNHCENPACVAICPTGAMYKTEEGPVLHDDEMCIGCKSCTLVCPYKQPKFVAELGIVQKCDSCYAIRKAGGVPVCVDACPMRALDFGDMDELAAKYGEGLVTEIPVLPPADMTGPHTLIKAKEAMMTPAEELKEFIY
ncbi:MAG: 4Fe-4S dicluster domain-containing protein [Lachnospiraceae bacterium]|nr:4Fe-4S dicluster domain-containing protein [Lachnospiraceae bacterium]